MKSVTPSDCARIVFWMTEPFVAVNDGQQARGGVRADRLQELVAAAVGQVQVQQHQVRRFRAARASSVCLPFWLRSCRAIAPS